MHALIAQWIRFRDSDWMAVFLNAAVEGLVL